jgi:hypothetical protein
MMTVLLSIFVHGLSAGPGIAIYARRNASSQAVNSDKLPFEPGDIK